MTSELSVASDDARAAVGQVGGPLSLADLAALLQALAEISSGQKGREHNLETAVSTARERIARGIYPQLLGVEGLGPDDEGIYGAVLDQAAAALGRAVWGRVPDDPVTAALNWQQTICPEGVPMLPQMLRTAAEQVAAEAAHARAEALLGGRAM